MKTANASSENGFESVPAFLTTQNNVKVNIYQPSYNKSKKRKKKNATISPLVKSNPNLCIYAF